MLERVAGLALGVNDDHVGGDLRQALGQEHIGRKHGDDVVAAFEQADAQPARTLGFGFGGAVVGVSGEGVGRDDDDAQGGGRCHVNDRQQHSRQWFHARA